MDWTSDNLAEAFHLFEQRLQLLFKVKKVREVDQVSHILLQVGKEGLRRFNSWTLTEEEEADPATILQLFKEQLEPVENFCVSWLRHMDYRQCKDESLDDFVNSAKLQAQKYDFSANEINKRLLELIIAGTPDPDFQKSLLSKEKAFTLEDALKLGHIYQATAAHVKDLKGMQTSVLVETIKYRGCNYCGTKHASKKCPAFGSNCRACGKANHRAKVCCSSGRGSSPQQQQGHGIQRIRARSQRGGHHNSRQQVHELQTDPEPDDNFKMLTFNNIQISSLQLTRNEAFVKLNVRLTSRPGIHKLVLKVDTRAQGNTLPLRIYSQMFPDQLTKDGLQTKNVGKAAHQVRLTAYNGTNIPCYGIIDVPCKFKDSGWKNTE